MDCRVFVQVLLVQADRGPDELADHVRVLEFQNELVAEQLLVLLECMVVSLTRPDDVDRVQLAQVFNDLGNGDVLLDCVAEDVLDFMLVDKVEDR